MTRKFNSEKKKKSIVKRIFKWTGITFLLLLILVIILPFLFKDKLIEIVKEEVNNTLNAKVDFGEFDLTLFSTFPNFTFEINNVTVDGVDHFEGVRLAEIKRTDITLDLMSVISGDKYEVKAVNLNEPTFNVIVDKEGFANYDIAKADSTVKSEETSSEETQYAIGLQSLTIAKANIIYDDQQGGMYTKVKNLDFEMTGDFTQDIFDVSTKTGIEALTYKMAGINYMNKDKVDLLADVTIDKFVKYTLKENDLKINELDLGFDGWLELLDESMNMDITFESKQTAFKNILSLVPSIYLTDFNGVKTKGTLALNGMVKGEMKGDKLPAFDVNMTVGNGYFKYPDLPNSADNINVKVNITHPQGILDKMKINIPKFHVELAQNPIDATLKLSNPITDPNITSNIIAKLDLEKLETVMPMTAGEEYNGLIDADIHIGGRLSALEQEQYQNFKAEGMLGITNMLYKSKELTYDVMIKKTDVEFTPQFANLKTFESQMGTTDIVANGKIDNILQYLLMDEELKGTFNVNSNKMDLDELMSVPEVATADADEAEKASEEEEPEVFRVPANYNMNLNADIKELIYDGLPVKNIKGKVGIKDETALMNNVSMNTMGGNIILNGSYNSQKINPLVDFNYNIKSVNVEHVVQYFNTIETIAPIAKKCKGKISTNLNMATELDQTMSPLLNTINGFGGLTSNTLTVAGVKVLDKLADVLKIKDISEQTLKNLNLSFAFKDGRVVVKPFDTKLSGMKTNVSGYTSFDQSIKYDLEMEVPKAKLGGKANEFMESIMGKANAKGLDVSVPNIIPVSVIIGGTVTNPKLQTNLRSKATDLVNNIKDKVLDTIKKTFNAEIDKILADAQAQADKIRTEAKVKADKLRVEGKAASEKAKAEALKVADNLKAQAYKAADDVEKSAKNPLEKIGKQAAAKAMRIEADKKYAKAVEKANAAGDISKNQADDKANKLETEADKRAQQVLDAANVKANQLKR